MVSLNIYKNSTNKFGRKTGFKIENEIEDRDQSIPKFIGILTQVFCTFGPNLVILAWTGDELSCRQAQNVVTFDFEVKFDLEGQGQSPPKTIGILAKVFYTYGPNLAILAWTGDELSRGQASHQPHHKSIRPNSLPTRTPHHLHNTTLPGGGTPSLKVVGRLPGTHGLKSLWAPKKGGQNSMCCRRAKKNRGQKSISGHKKGVNILWVTEK